MTPRTGLRLGIDFGTTHTVAVLETADGRAQPLLFDSSPLLSSAVYADPDGTLLTGRDGERSARLDPTRYEPNPKRRIDEPTILLGATEYQVPQVIAAVLGRVAAEAIRAGGAPPAQTVLTYPANWGATRKEVLARAAADAGLPAVTLVPEPVAAAAHFTGVLGRTVNPGEALAVYDFGAGTFDASVVRRSADGAWELAAYEGLTDVGGLDLDATLVDRIGQTLGASDPQRWDRLTNPTTAADRRARRTLWEDVRAAKEQLSRTSSAAVHIPTFDADTHLTRDEFEVAARPLLIRTVDVMARLAGRPGTRLAGLYLVGGSSRIPLIATLLHQRLGLPPILIEQPELVVAQGSLRAAAPPVFGAPVFGAPVFGPPIAAPVSGPPGVPVSAAPGPPGPPGAAPVSASPMSGPPTSGPPRPMPTPGVPLWASTVPQPAVPATRRPRRRSRKLRWVLAAAAALLLLSCGGYALREVSDSLKDGRVNAGAGQNAGQTADPAGSTGPGRLSTGPGGRQQLDVKRTVWYSGNKITLGLASYDPAAESPLQVDITMENLGAEEERYFRTLQPFFAVDGQITKGELKEISTLPAGATSKGKFLFDPEKRVTNLAAGVLSIGDSAFVQAVVPLGDPAKTVNLEPKKVAGASTFTVGQMTYTVSSCELRADILAEYQQVKRDFRALECRFDVKFNKTTGSFHTVSASNMLLKLPDRTVVAPEAITTDPGFNTIFVDPQEQVTGAFVAYAIRWPASGTYTLRVHDSGDDWKQGPGPGNLAEVPMTLS